MGRCCGQRLFPNPPHLHSFFISWAQLWPVPPGGGGAHCWTTTRTGCWTACVCGTREREEREGSLCACVFFLLSFFILVACSCLPAVCPSLSGTLARERQAPPPPAQRHERTDLHTTFAVFFPILSLPPQRAHRLAMPPLARGRRQWHPPHHRAAATVAALALALALSSPARAQPRLLTAALDAASGQLGAWVQGAYGRDSVPIRTPADVRALLTLPSGEEGGRNGAMRAPGWGARHAACEA